MARGSSDDLVRLVVVGGIAYVGYDFARQGKLGDSAKRFADEIDKLLGRTSLPGLPGVGSDAEVAAWARGVGLSYEVGRRFKAEFGGMPSTIAQLEEWGNRKGYRRAADGVWLI